MKKHNQRHHHSLLLGSLALVLMPALSQAQSAYSVTVLKSPTSYPTEATDMDNTGKVVGYSFDRTLGIGGFDFPTLSTFWRGRALSWSTSTAASITGSKGASYYSPMKTNEVGVTAGFSTIALPTQNSDGFMQPATEKAGKVTKLSNQNALQPGFNNITIGGINKLGVVAASGRYYATDAAPTPSYMSAVLITPGQTLALEHPGHAVAYAHDINDQGMAVGSVIATGEAARAAIWNNGKLSWVGQPYTEARAVNNAGQVLVVRSTLGIVDYPVAPWPITGADPKGAAALWLGGQSTPIGTNSQVVTPTSMNASGTVVGCASGRAFLWKNGVMLDLLTEVNSKGAKLPTSTLLNCPVAINDTGSVLLSYQTVPGAPKTWIRLNAKP